jgi:uncharacterized protein YeaO (DUF488 family)
MTDLKLHTAQWTVAWRHSKAVGAGNEGFMPVRTSVGTPRFWPEANALPVPKLITPYGLRKISDYEEFKVRHRARLDESGVDSIRRELTEIAEAYGNKPLALLCFEKEPSECHRSLFAEWWEGQTDERIAELQPVSNGGHASDPAKLTNERYGRLRQSAQPQLAPSEGAERNP